MPEKPQIELQDIAKESEPKSEGLEVVKGPELDQVVDKANAISEAMQQDKNITEGQMQDLEKSLGELKYDVCGEQMTMAEISKIPDFKHNYETWKKIVAGDDIYHYDMTYLIPSIADMLSNSENGDVVIDEIGAYDRFFLDFQKLETISAKAARQLLKYEGDDIYLNAITSLTDDVAENLGKFHCKLHLNYLRDISDKGLVFLARADVVLPEELIKRLFVLLDNDFPMPEETEQKLFYLKEHRYAQGS